MKPETKQQQGSQSSFTPRPNLNELAKQVYQANRLKGFHDEEHSNEHYLSLVISELYEAVEADRKGRTANIDLMNRDIEEKKRYRDSILNSKVPLRPDTIDRLKKNSTDEAIFKAYFETYIKDSVADELADAIIRLLDLTGMRGYDLSSIPDEHSDISKYLSLTENIYKIIQNMMIPFYAKVAVPAYVLIDIEYLASEIMQIDIWRHVDLKIKYNATRERLHGKRY